jgi:hypothetical protein
MRTHSAAPALVAVALTVAATLSVTAQNQAIATTPRSMASATTTVTKATAARLKADAFSTIQGNALTSTNGPLNDIIVRLRDARFGRIVGSQTTDKSGLFEFKSVDPGTYIVEVMANDQSAVLAASQLLNINGGEAVSAVVKLPFRIPAFAGIMGSTSMPSAAAVAGEAAASGIASIVPTVPVSPTQ